MREWFPLPHSLSRCVLPDLTLNDTYFQDDRFRWMRAAGGHNYAGVWDDAVGVECIPIGALEALGVGASVVDHGSSPYHVSTAANVSRESEVDKNLQASCYHESLQNISNVYQAYMFESEDLTS